MSEPLVSILTITYNRADLIHRCIESIQRQTYKNYEHIIADGNSTDNTEEIVKSYNNPHIKYIKLNDRGPEFQMRSAFEASSGDYITFLDDDDEYLPDKIAKQVEFALKQPDDVGLTYCWMTMYDSQTNEVTKTHAPQYSGECYDICAAYGKISGTPTLFIRREVFRSVGGTFDDSIGLIMSDIELVTRISKITKVNYLSESLIKVYVNHNHARLTTNFYSETLKRVILYHTHFLTKFSDVFQKHPTMADYHCFELCRAYFKLHNYKEGFKYYRRLLSCNPSFTQVIKPLIGIILNK